MHSFVAKTLLLLSCSSCIEDKNRAQIRLFRLFLKLHIIHLLVDAFIFFRTPHYVEERPPEEEAENSFHDFALPDDGLDPQENKREKRKCCLCNVV